MDFGQVSALACDPLVVQVDEHRANESDGGGIGEDSDERARRLTSLSTRSSGLVDQTLRQCSRGDLANAVTSAFASSISGPSLGNRAASSSRCCATRRGRRQRRAHATAPRALPGRPGSSANGRRALASQQGRMPPSCPHCAPPSRFASQSWMRRGHTATLLRLFDCASSRTSDAQPTSGTPSSPSRVAVARIIGWSLVRRTSGPSSRR